MDQQRPLNAPAPVSPPVAALLASLAPVLAQQAAELPGPVALADVRALLSAGDALRAGVLGRISDVELRQLYSPRVQWRL